MLVSEVLAGRADTLRLVTLPVIRIFVIFFPRDIFQTLGAHGVHSAAGLAGGGVCLNGRGLKPVSGDRDTGAVNRALAQPLFWVTAVTSMRCSYNV